jgi:hypothetical protein
LIKAGKEAGIELHAPEPGGELDEIAGAAFVPVVAVQAPEAARRVAPHRNVAGSVLVRVPLGVDVRTLAGSLRAVR